MQTWIILKKDGSDRYVYATESCQTAANAYNTDYFEVLHWDLDTWGAAPPSADLETKYVIPDESLKKRASAYKMELEDLKQAWESQKYLDGDDDETELSGTLTFITDNNTVSGSGTSFTTELAVGSYIQLNSEKEYAEEIESIENDTSLTLVATYKGSGGSGVGSNAMLELGKTRKKRREIKDKYPL